MSVCRGVCGCVRGCVEGVSRVYQFYGYVKGGLSNYGQAINLKYCEHLTYVVFSYFVAYLRVWDKCGIVKIRENLHVFL